MSPTLIPRQALWFFLIYMPFAGTVTYTLGGGNPLFQLSKDVFYLPALLALLQECRRKRKPIIVSKKLLLTLSILVIICLTYYSWLMEHKKLWCPIVII